MDTTTITYILVIAIAVFIPGALIVWKMLRHRQKVLEASTLTSQSQIGQCASSDLATCAHPVV